MITWYSPKEKLPEIGDEIVIYDDIKGCHPLEMYIGKVSLSNDKGLIIGERDFNFLTIGNYTGWAYASDFNFPKSES